MIFSPILSFQAPPCLIFLFYKIASNTESISFPIFSKRILFPKAIEFSNYKRISVNGIFGLKIRISFLPTIS
jgi:hypothetical protein